MTTETPLTDAGGATTTLWLSRVAESNPLFVGRPFATSLLAFGLPLDALAAVYVAQNYATFDLAYFVASALGLVWMNVAPFAIWYHDRRLTEAFVARATEIAKDDDRVESVVARTERTFRTLLRASIVVWTLGTVGVFAEGLDLFATYGIEGPTDAFFWTTLAYSVLVGVLWGTGFASGLRTILHVRAVASLGIDIDPMHPDSLGGLSNVGFYAVRTTMLLSTPSLWLPLGFLLATGSDIEELVGLIVSAYVLLLLLVFAYPTALVSLRAQATREDRLDALRREYNERKSKIAAAEDDMERLRREQELRRVRDEYNDYKAVRLYPVELTILTQLAGSILLPIVLFLLEQYLSQTVL